MKILVADDSKTTLALITESLRKLGHEVIPVSNGQQALEEFQKNRPDLIILDVIMEGIDGFECARRIRAFDSDDWIPIIFLSGAVDDENIAKGINAGGDDYLTKPFSEITLASKIKAMQRIADMRQKLYESTKQLSVLSSTDALTGIYNRLQFDKTIKEKIGHAQRHKTPIALLFLDLDNFKTINDSLGHYVGDMLLREVATRLQSSLRVDDFIARIGGDEFAIILSDIKTKQTAGEIAEKIIKSLSPVYKIGGNEIHISTSIGISCYPSEESNLESLVQNADIAMYHAKEMGRNNFQYFTKDLSKTHDNKVAMENALKFAHERRELFLSYQPVFDLVTYKITRIEALVGWDHPSLGRIPASEFIPLAEELGLIEIIGQWVLRNAFEQSAKWAIAHLHDFILTVNISPRQLLQKSFPTNIANLIDDTHLTPNLVELELTETSALTYSQLLQDIINKLSALGIKIALDDFGTGFSSLNHLKDLPISAIKIDKSFIQDLKADSANAMIVKSLITLGENLKFDVIAEGIETDRQMQFLLNNGCSQGQGYLLCKPMKEEEMTKYLLNIKNKAVLKE